MNIISLDKDRVNIYENYVTKKTNQNEFDSLKLAHLIASNLKPLIIFGDKYQISIPKIYRYSDNLITMERCFGNNLELILRHKTTYNDGVIFLNSLLNFFLSNNFYWKDFAPRNILIDKGKISIMDFERGISEKVQNLQLYFVDSVYEEYGAFVLPNDRIYSIEDIFISNDNNLIALSNISSKRVKTILKIQGYNDYVPINDYILAVKMIVTNEIPYKKNDEIIFPLLELEDYIKKYGYQEYAKRIIGGYNARQKKL